MSPVAAYEHPEAHPILPRRQVYETPAGTTSTTVVTVHASPTIHVSDVPQIGGSSAGFIALVVTFAVIIVVCVIGVFFLLRNYSPTPHERRSRQAHARKHSSLYELPVGPAGMRSKFARLFKSKRGAGWVRTADEEADEWNAADDGVFRGQDTGTSERDDSHPPSFQVVRGSQNAHGMSMESVEAALEAPSEASPSSVSPSRLVFSATPPHDDDPPSSSTSAEHPHPEDRASRREDSRFSVQSGLDGHVRSMRKLENGTKFRENLDP